MANTNSTLNATAKKLTKRDHFNALLAIPSVASNPTLVEFIENELDLLARKNAKPSGKQSEKQEANDALKQAMLDYLANDGGQHTVTDFIKNVPECAGLSQQKITALVRQMVEDGKLEKVIEKRVSYFKLAEV